MTTNTIPTLNAVPSSPSPTASIVKQVRAAALQVTWPLRLVLTGMLIGLLWKFAFFRIADQVYSAIPLHDNFFPGWLQQAASLRIAFLTAIASIVIAWITQESKTRRIAISISGLACTVMLLHQGTYNDMTFTTIWWCNVWALWYVWRMDVDPPGELRRKAAFLSRLLISVVLIGGAVGKMTGEYWSGEVFYEIYFRDRDFWVFNALRSWLDTETLRWTAMAYSRHVIFVEFIGGLSIWLLPARWAALAGVVIFGSIGLLSNFLLFSVLAPLIGLAMVGWYAQQREETRTEPAKARCQNQAC